MNDIVLFSVGLLCAVLGGNLFVRGVNGLSDHFRIAPGIIGLTVAAFSTSSPELAVTINAAAAGKPQIALGDALGSNIVNIAFVLAIALLLGAMQSSPGSISRDFRTALMAPLLIAVLFIDGTLSRIDGALLLFVLVFWLAMVGREIRRQRAAIAPDSDDGDAKPRGLQTAGQFLLGLLLLLGAGRLIVISATGIARLLGIDEFIVGATVVAIGTSVPELATTLIARHHGHEEVGLGNILGSNIFNAFFIIGIAAIISPIVVPLQELAFVLGVGMVAVFAAHPNRRGEIPRWRGLALLMLYVIYGFSLFLA